MATNQLLADSTAPSLFELKSDEGGKTATLGDLIESLDGEVNKLNGERITAKTLQRTLDFLRKSIGVSVVHKDQPLPLALIKTIRLLFLTDLNESRNVFGLLAPPETDAHTTMEFSTVTTIPRDPGANAVLESLCSALANEIEPSKLRSMSLMVSRKEQHSVAEELLLHVERTNDEVSHSLQDAFGADEALLTEALDSLTGQLNVFRVGLMDGVSPTAIEAMYVYLQTLPFLHFVRHYPIHLDKTRISGGIGCIQDDAVRFCDLATNGAQHQHGPASRVFSVNTFHHLLSAHPKEMCELVRKATGITLSLIHI